MNECFLLRFIFSPPVHCKGHGRYSEKVGRVVNPTGRGFFLFPTFSFSSPLAPPSPLLWSLSGHQPAFDLSSVCLSRHVKRKRGAVADVQLVGLRRVILGKSVCRGTSNGERERRRAHGAQTRRRAEREREKGAQISVAFSWFSRTLDARNRSV